MKKLNKEAFKRYVDSLKFALYCTTHPLDGFWDLTHEHRGTMAAANTILILTLFTRIFKLKYTSFIIDIVYWPKVNIFLYLGSVVFVLALWCLGNWGLTTLFDGKGRLGQIYMATCYAMTPYPLVTIPMVVIGNGLAEEEIAVYNVIVVAALVWAAFLILAAMIQIHEYTMSKTLLFTVATGFAMLVLVFILLLFFSMIGQGVAYIVSIIKEILFRM